MRISSGRVIEVQLDPQGGTSAWIACPPEMVPGPGQYLLAWSGEDELALGTPLFPADASGRGFLAAPPLPRTWNPGTVLNLRGVLGRGFHPPPGLQRLACAALGDTSARLLPLVRSGLDQGMDVALYTSVPLPALPASLEVHPLSSLPEVLSWAELLALDLPLEFLPRLRSTLGLGPGLPLPCPAQALVWTAMPCAGLAACGACAVPSRGGWKLACEDGPVFDLMDLEW